MSRWVSVLLLGAMLRAPLHAQGRFEEDLRYHGNTLRHWLQELRSPDRVARLRATRVLRQVGPEAHDAVPALLMLLKSEDGIVRNRTVAALVRAGPNHIPLFRAALSFDEARLVYGSARVLGEMGPEARSAIPALERQLRSSSPDSRILSALALWQISRSSTGINALRKELRGPSSNQQWAGWALAQFGPAAAEAAPDLVATLASRDDRVRAYAFEALEAIGPAAVSALVAGLNAPHAGARVEAAEALGRIGPATERAIPRLLAQLREGQPGVAVAAVRALGRIGLADRDVLDALRDAIRDRDGDLRAEAARALAALGPHAEPAGRELCQALRDPSRPVRRAAALALVRIGKPAVPLLAELAKDPDHLVRRQALVILGAIGPESHAALSALRASMQEPGNAVRLAAIDALAAVGAPAVDALAEGLAADREVRLACARALERLGPIAAPAQKALTEALNEKEEGFRHAVLAALRALGPAAHASVPLLVRLATTIPSLRQDVLMTLHAIRPSARDVLSLVRTALTDEREAVRLEALALLYLLGAEGKAAIEEVRGLLRSGGPVIRRHAASWLLRHGEARAVATAAAELLASDEPSLRSTGILVADKDLLPAVRERLRDKDLAVRLSAALACWRLERSPRTVSTLIDLLGDRTRRTVSPGAFRVLGRLGRDAWVTVPLLAAIVHKDPALELRVEAARTLGAIGPEAAPALPVLFDLLLDLLRWRDREIDEASDAITTGAVRDLTFRDPSGHEDADLRRAASRALVAVRAHGMSEFSKLEGIVDDVSVRMQDDLLDQIGAIGPGAATLARHDLSSTSREIRRRGVLVLRRLGSQGREAAGELRALIGVSSPMLEVEVLSALHAVTGEGDKHIDALVRLLGNTGPVSARTARLLGEIGPSANRAVPALIQALRRREALLRREAARALGKMGQPSKEVRAALEERLRDRNMLVRVRAALSLRELGMMRDPLPFLVAGLEPDNPTGTRLESIAALAKEGGRAKPFVHRLRPLCHEESDEVRLAAAHALWKISGETSLALPIASRIAVQRSVRPAVRRAALEWLQDLGNEAAPAVFALEELPLDPTTPPELVRLAEAIVLKVR